MGEGVAIAPAPRVTVVVATRDRGDSVVGTLRSILANGLAGYDVAIVDQSEDDRTATALGALLADPRVRYRRSATVGLARAHNLAIAEATSDLVAITDDDCEVPPDWLARLVRAFAIDDRIGVVFGNVLPAEHDATTGFVPAYVLAGPVLARDLRDKTLVDGMGACMGLRRRTWVEVGGFDERFGAGAPFRAADEGELSIRALAAGWFVHETPELQVIHHGFRRHAEGRALVRGYVFGTGAMVGTHVRRGTPHAPWLLAAMGLRWARGHVHGAVRLDGGRHRWLRLGAFAHGFVAGLGAR